MTTTIPPLPDVCLTMADIRHYIRSYDSNDAIIGKTRDAMHCLIALAYQRKYPDQRCLVVQGVPLSVISLFDPVAITWRNFTLSKELSHVDRLWEQLPPGDVTKAQWVIHATKNWSR